MSRRKIKRKASRLAGLVMSPEEAARAAYTRDEVQAADEPIVVVPDKEQIAAAIQFRQVCGECRRWNYSQGQEMIRVQKFDQRLIREEKHRREWYETKDQYGWCEETETLIPAGCPARLSRYIFDSSYVGAKGFIKPGGMDRIPCERFEHVSKRGRQLIVGPGINKNLEG